jgi:hypothetical protein
MEEPPERAPTLFRHSRLHGVIDFETGCTYATNPGNLRLELADFLEGQSTQPSEPQPASDTELKITHYCNSLRHSAVSVP